MPNPKAQASDYCDGFGLTNHELELVRALPDTSRCFLIKHANHSVVARLDLSGMADVLTLLSGRESTVRTLDELRAVVGDRPDAWLAQLLGKTTPQSAALQEGEHPLDPKQKKQVFSHIKAAS
jgi:type IV secretion system protein VirB4